MGALVGNLVDRDPDLGEIEYKLKFADFVGHPADHEHPHQIGTVDLDHSRQIGSADTANVDHVPRRFAEEPEMTETTF